MTGEPPTKAKKAIKYFENHPLFSKIIVIGTIVIALGAVAAAINNIRELSLCAISVPLLALAQSIQSSKWSEDKNCCNTI